jgi:hypothetical protein
MTLEEAEKLILRMRVTRPYCKDCPTLSYQEVEGNRCPPAGYSEAPHIAGYIKRCEKCARTERFPWAERLTPQAVVDFIDREPWRNHDSWPLSDLEPLAK